MSESPLPTIKVLLVEDDTRLAQLTSRYLETHGVLVTIASDGIEGQAEEFRRQYDCIVLDLMLPGRDVPIVMVTARGEEADRSRARRRCHAHVLARAGHDRAARRALVGPGGVTT